MIERPSTLLERQAPLRGRESPGTGGFEDVGAMGDLAGFSKSRLVVLPGTSHFIPPGSGVMDRAEWLLAMVPPFLDAPLAETTAE